MKIQILKQTTAGRLPARPGDVIEIPDAEAQRLIGSGYAMKSTLPLKRVGKDGKPVKAAAPPAPIVPPKPVTPPAGGETKP